jgi:hypothetical protein
MASPKRLAIFFVTVTVFVTVVEKLGMSRRAKPMDCGAWPHYYWQKLNPSRHTWFVFESGRRRLQKLLSALDGMDPNIHAATVEGVMRELCNAFVGRRGAVPSVPDMMKTYRRVVRHLDDVLVNARGKQPV